MLYTTGFIIFAIGIPIIIPLGIIRIIFNTACQKQSRSSKANTSCYSQNCNSKTDLSTSGIMLLIGTAFIVLSGLAFGVASWVKTTPKGRILIMLGAAVFAIVISIILKKVIRLSRTSAAFYIIGTILAALTLIVAGYYELLGEWLSVYGDGMGMLMALSFAVIACSLFIGYILYKMIFFAYIALSAVSLVHFFTALQFSVSNEDFALMMIVFQTIITALIHIPELQHNTYLVKPVQIVGDLTSVLFGVIAFVHVIDTMFAANIFTYLILGLIIIQLIGYGILKKHFWMLRLQSIFTVYTIYVIGFSIYSYFNESLAIVVTASMMIFAHLLNRFSRSIKTVFSEVFTLIFAVISSLIVAGNMNSAHFVFELIIIAVVSIILASYVFSRFKAVQVMAGLTAPIFPFIGTGSFYSAMCSFFEYKDTKEIAIIFYSILALIFIAATAFILWLPQYAFIFHAKHPRRTDTILYTNMTVASIILIFLTENSSVFMVPVIVNLIHFALSNKLSCNITAVAPVISLSLITYNITKFNGYSAFTVMTALMILFILMMIISRITFKNYLFRHENCKFIADPLMISAWLPIVLMFDITKTGFFMSSIALGIYFVCFIRKNTSSDAVSILLTISTVLIATAFIFRPFMVVDSEIISSKITLAIIALIGAACKVIWRKHRKSSLLSSTMIFILSFSGLIIDAIYFQTAGNTIFVMMITVLILLVSLISKCRTWFMTSSIALFTVTIYATREYLMALNWWVYLFAAGMILISVAATNEYYKTKGETVRSCMAKAFSDWTW